MAPARSCGKVVSVKVTIYEYLKETGQILIEAFTKSERRVVNALPDEVRRRIAITGTIGSTQFHYAWSHSNRTQDSLVTTDCQIR